MQNQNTSLTREIVFSSIAAFVAVAAWAIIMHAIHTNTAIFLPVLASMGASACMMFAIPHSPLAQPWPVFGGHLCSAVVGVACSQWLLNVNLAAAAAVALSILIMHFLRCLHPPSAATTLIAIFGGAEIHALGWQFCYEVVVLNVSIIVGLALVINQLIPNRRYPMRHSHHPHHTQLDEAQMKAQGLTSYEKLTEQDFKWALTQMDGVIDVTEEDLVDLHEFAREHALKRMQA